MTGGQAVEISAAAPADHSRRRSWALLAVLLALSVLDSYDTQSIAFVGGVLAREWGISTSSLGLVFSAGLLGGLFGALASPAMAARLGHRSALVWLTLWFAVGSGVMVVAKSVPALLAIRFVTGVALGAALPIVVAIASRDFPERFKARAMAVVLSGATLGGFCGGFLAAAIVPRYGWASVFVVGAIAPILLLPSIVALIPSRAVERARSAVSDGSGASGPSRGWAALPELLGPKAAPRTIAIWVTCFLGVGVTYSLLSWTPTILQMSGFSLQAALVGGSVLYGGATIAPLTFGSLMDRFGRYGITVACFALAAPFVLGLGFSSSFGTAAMAIAFLAGFLVVGGQFCTNVIAALNFAPEVRVLAISCQLVAARVGGVAAPAIGGRMMDHGHSPVGFFSLLALASLGAAGGVIFLKRSDPSPTKRHA